MKKYTVQVVDLLLIYLLFACPLAYTHVLSLYHGFALLAVVGGSYATGAVMMGYTGLRQILAPFSATALSVFFGGMVLSLMVFVTTNPYLLLALLLLTTIVIGTIMLRNIAFKFSLSPLTVVIFVSFAAALVLLSVDGDLERQFTAVQSGTDCYTSDRYYFTSLVNTIRHGSIFSASFEQGTPLDYQVLGFFFPSLLAQVVKLSSHQALWGLAQPFYKLVVMTMCYEFCYFFAQPRVTRGNYLLVVLSVFLPILMAPLNPVYVFKGVVSKFIFHGMSYLAPTGTITFPVTIILMLVTLLLFFNIDWSNRKVTFAKLFFTVCLAVNIIAKVPMYATVLIFVGSLVLYRVVFQKESILNYLGYGVASLLISGMLFKYCLNILTGGRTFFHYGYLTNLIAEWYGKHHVGSGGIVFGLLLVASTFVLWLGIRLIGLVALLKNRERRATELLIGSVMALTLITALCSFLHMELLSSDGTLLHDNTFNIDQFIRSAFYLCSVTAAAGMVKLFLGNKPLSRGDKVIAVITALWCLLTLVSTVDSLVARPEPCPVISWYEDNYQELKTGKYGDQLLAVNPYYQDAIMLSGCDYGTYWTCCGENRSIIHEYRWRLYRQLIDSASTTALTQMKREGVRYLIATPDDSAGFSKVAALYPAQIAKVSNTRWFYQVR